MHTLHTHTTNPVQYSQRKYIDVQNSQETVTEFNWNNFNYFR